MVKCEIHTHTQYSHDSYLNFYGYLIRLKMKKINIVGITDHNEIEGAISFKKKLKKFGIDVIVGEEIFTESGEVIGLFLKEKIKPGLSLKETIKEIKKQKGLVYIPHPYDLKRNKTVIPFEEIKKYKKEIDFIEIHNGRNIEEYYSEIQYEIYNEISDYVVPVVGSDAHTFFELGRNYMNINNFAYEGDPKEFKKMISNANFNKKKCLPIFHEITKIVRVVKHLSKGDFNGLFRIAKKKFKRRFV